MLDFATNKIERTWPIPGGGSPDMGNVSADGKYFWLSGRFDNVVYRIDTRTGAIRTIAVGHEPHGLASGRCRAATPSAIPELCVKR